MTIEVISILDNKREEELKYTRTFRVGYTTG